MGKKYNIKVLYCTILSSQQSPNFVTNTDYGPISKLYITCLTWRYWSSLYQLVSWCKLFQCNHFIKRHWNFKPFVADIIIEIQAFCVFIVPVLLINLNFAFNLPDLTLKFGRNLNYLVNLNNLVTIYFFPVTKLCSWLSKETIISCC